MDITFNRPIDEYTQLETSLSLQTALLHFTAELTARDHNKLIQDHARIQLSQWLCYKPYLHVARLPSCNWQICHSLEDNNSLPISLACPRFFIGRLRYPTDSSAVSSIKTHRMPFPGAPVVRHGHFVSASLPSETCISLQSPMNGNDVETLHLWILLKTLTRMRTIQFRNLQIYHPHQA